MSANLQKLEAMLGAEEKELTAEELIAVATQVDDTLQQGDETIDDWLSEFDDGRAELSHFSARILTWLTVVPVTLTVLFGWIGLSQVSTFMHARKWSRGTNGGKDASPTPT